MKLTVRKLKNLLKLRIVGPGVKVYIYSPDGKTRTMLDEDQIIEVDNDDLPVLPEH